MDRTCIISSLIIFGIVGIVTGIWTRLGKNRAWYLVPNYYVLLPKNGHYALPVAGLMMITIGISLMMPEPALVRKVWLIGVFPLGAIVFLIVVFAPKWLKPKWVQWLEENHGDIIEILIREGRNTPDWAEQVSTQEGLEAWIAEVRLKYSVFADNDDPNNFQPGAEVLWNRAASSGKISSVKAIVVETTAKRVKIQFNEDGQQRVRSVMPRSLDLKDAEDLSKLFK